MQCASFLNALQARANAILALASSNIMLLDHSLQSTARDYAHSPKASLSLFSRRIAERAIEKLNLEAERCVVAAVVCLHAHITPTRFFWGEAHSVNSRCLLVENGADLRLDLEK